MKSSIEIRQIGITELDADVIVNAANSQLLAGGGVENGVDLGTRVGFCDIAATVLEALGVEQGSVEGKSFWGEVRGEA